MKPDVGSTDRRATERLAQRVLSDPALYPDEFKAWLPRWLATNVNFSVDRTQLPAVESYRIVGATGNAAFSGTWVNFGGSNAVVAYYKNPFGRVFLKGTAKSGTVPSTIFTLPAGYRPGEAEIFGVASNGLFGVCTVNPDGTVVASAGSNVYFSLAGISFRAF